ncbi:aldose epimerase family protein [Pseudovibrio exalbescens]|uniref:Aldose 1-epimerase n=1 Tax=Pseudovibrio exalbescens TaxID=197461 RepID=A0A1U7JDR2_9HYPH|nr:aldose epimerase family protein [Pseudovibrio exalbescens]OKL42896.1 hypothetical protein A3843_16365 [Pseudovibrio exalbescens]
MKISAKAFGIYYNQQVNQLKMENNRGMSVSILELGGIITELYVPDEKDQLADVVLGFENLKAYTSDKHYFGALIGRVANRIEGASFELDGETVKVDANAYKGRHCVHGGRFGYHRRVWKLLRTEAGDDFVAVVLLLNDLDGEEGFRHDVNVEARYELNDKNQLSLSFTANANGPTPISLTAHSYFNLEGHESGTIRNHELIIYGDRYLEQRADRIPNGEILPVTGTEFDFQNYSPLSPVVERGIEINHSYCFPLVKHQPQGCIRKLAEVKAGGRRLVVSSNEETLHFYNGHNLDGVEGKQGSSYTRFSGLCLEPKGFVNGVNDPAFPCTILDKGRTYHHQIIYDFEL